MSKSLHSLVVDALGRKIVSGALPQGAVVRAEVLEREFGVSRSVIREAVRSLQLLGMTESVKSLGIRVLDQSAWNPYASEIIRWRLSDADQGAQLRSLTELRLVVEPAAAGLCATNASPEIAAHLILLAAAMAKAGAQGDLEEFERLDIEFHAALLAGSGNEMFAHLAAPIGAVLHGRTLHGLMPKHPHQEAVQWHVDVAEAVQSGKPAVARKAMQLIVERTVEEIEHMWQESARVVPSVATIRTKLEPLFGDPA